MAWPEPAPDGQMVSREMSKQDQSARHAATLIGGQESADAMFMRTWNARQRQAEAAAADADRGGDSE